MTTMQKTVPAIIRLSGGVALKADAPPAGAPRLPAEDPAAELMAISIWAYSGGVAKLGFGNAVFDLDGMDLPADGKMPLLCNHDPARIAGYSRSVARKGQGLMVAGVLSNVSESGRLMAGLLREGCPLQASVGLAVDVMEEIVENAEDTINGQTFAGPVYVAVKSTLREVSIVPLGADSKTATIAASMVRGSGAIARPPIAAAPRGGRPVVAAPVRSAAARFRDRVRELQASGLSSLKARRLISVEEPELQAAYVREINAARTDCSGEWDRYPRIEGAPRR